MINCQQNTWMVLNYLEAGNDGLRVENGDLKAKDELEEFVAKHSQEFLIFSIIIDHVLK